MHTILFCLTSFCPHILCTIGMQWVVVLQAAQRCTLSHVSDTHCANNSSFPSRHLFQFTPAAAAAHTKTLHSHRLALRVRRPPSCTQCWSSARQQWGAACSAQTTSTSCQGRRGLQAQPPSAGGLLARLLLSVGGLVLLASSNCKGFMTHTLVIAD